MTKKLSKVQIRKLTHNIPPTRYPRRLEDWYCRKIKSFVRAWKKYAMLFLNERLKPYIKGGVVVLDDKNDDPDWLSKLIQQLAIMNFTINHSEPDVIIDEVTGKFVKSINHFSFINVKAQTAIVGLDPISNNKAIRDYVKGKIAENTQLIKSMRSEYVDRLQEDIYRSITKGGGVTDVTSAITKRTHMANDHASLIANDQTGSIVSQLDSYRSKNAGSERYVWRSMEDNRVRPKHQELDGRTFKYDDPSGGDDGQLPGEPIRCRCVADPIF